MTGTAIDRVAFPTVPEDAKLSCGRRIGDGVHGQYFVGDGIAHQIEPLAAALRVPPAFEVQALGIVPEEQVLAPRLVAVLQPRPREARCAAARELAFVAQTAVNTADLHHHCAIPDAAASSISRP